MWTLKKARNCGEKERGSGEKERGSGEKMTVVAKKWKTLVKKEKKHRMHERKFERLFSLILLMLCQKSENWAAASRRKGITCWKFCQILISVQLRCIWRESIHLEYPKNTSDQRRQQLLFWIKIVHLQVCAALQVCACRNQTDQKFKFILFHFPSPGVKACTLKPRTVALWTPHKEHTESANRWKHLAPSRF